MLSNFKTKVDSFKDARTYNIEIICKGRVARRKGKPVVCELSERENVEITSIKKKRLYESQG